MWKILSALLIIICMLFIPHTLTYSQSKGKDKISGTISDAEDGSPLMEVNIYVKELNLGTATDAQGKFIMNEIPDGTYYLKISSIGYKTIEYKVIVPDNSSDINIQMQTATLKLKEVVVSGNPFLIEPKDISQSTVTMENLDLLIKQSNSVAQTLNFQPGISMRSNGRGAERPVIRGFSNNMVLVLQNGLRMGDLSGSSDDHGVSDDGSEPEKIEVLQGPASLLYGSNAIGGVVNIINDAIPADIPNGLAGYLKAEGSTVNEEYLGNAHFNYGINKFSFHGKFFKRSSKDYMNGNGEKTNNSFLDSYGSEFGFSFHPNWGMTGVSYQDYKNKYGLPTFSGNDELPFIDMHKKEFQLVTDANNIKSFITAASFKAGYSDYSHNEINKITNTIGTSFGLRTYAADLSFNHKELFKNSKGIIGLYGLIQNYNVSGEEALTPNSDYFNFAVYLLEQFRFGNLNTHFGTRYEVNKVKFPEAELTDSLFFSGDNIYNTLSLSFGAVYSLDSSYSIFTNIANAFRTPTIEELSSFGIHEASGSFDIGNRDLKRLNSLGLDLGFRGQTDRIFFELTGYYNFIDNYIFRSPQNNYYNIQNGPNPGFNPSQGFRVYNYMQANASVYGFESKINLELLRNFSLTLISDYVRAEIRKTKENLPQTPPFRLALELRYATPDYWFGGNWKMAAAQYDVAPYEEPTKGYGVIDLYAGIKLLTRYYAHVITLKADNLFNQAYKDHLSAIKDFTFMPGRNISLDYKFVF